MIREEIKNLIKKSIKKLQEEKVFLDFEIPEIKIEHPEEKMYGDYATNLALVIAKEVKKEPWKIAETIKSKIKSQKSKVLDEVEVAKPGFINFFLSKNFLIRELKKILKEKEKYGAREIGKGKRVVIDYSSPNIAKPFGIGHLRSTIIGQALYNIYKFLGWECIGINHLGDWGSQFGKLIFAIRKWGQKKLENYSIEDLEKLYVKFHQKAEKNPQLEKEGRVWFKKLEEGDKEAKEIWKRCVDISLKEFKRIYQLLGVKIDYTLGESFYEGMLKEIVKELREKNRAIESEGALIFPFPENTLPPAMILKSDGATTYFTRDLAAIKYRIKTWKPDLFIYETGAEQKLHFSQLFLAVELLGWEKREKFFHVGHGLLRFKEGKLSTRKGKTLHLELVLKKAIEKAKGIIEKSETGRGLSPKERERVAKLVGIGAVKYNDLCQHYSQDIIFDWEKILNLKGNSGPYLQYTFARCQSVLRKAKFKINFKKLRVFNFNKEEGEILREIYKFPEVVEDAGKNFSPHLICNFIFNLAQKYNLFYDLHPILKAKPEKVKILRLALTFAVSQILKNSFSLLGISPLKKM